MNVHGTTLKLCESAKSLFTIENMEESKGMILVAQASLALWSVVICFH